jgi:hypothetical protein
MEVSQLLQTSIASTILQSGNCYSSASASNANSTSGGSSSSTSSSCPYSDMTVRIERVEWTGHDNSVTLRWYATASVRNNINADDDEDDPTESNNNYAAMRSGTTAFDRRQELDAFILDFWYGDVFFVTLSEVLLNEEEADYDDDPIVGRARSASSAVSLAVSDNQSRLYRTRSPGASALAGTILFVAVLFAADGLVRYLTPLHQCASHRRRTVDIVCDDDDDENDWDGGGTGPSHHFCAWMPPSNSGGDCCGGGRGGSATSRDVVEDSATGGSKMPYLRQVV